MKKTKLAYTIGIAALCTLAVAGKMAAQEHGKIITFDAPGAGTNPGSPFCFGACPGTVAVNANREGVVIGYLVDNSNVYHGFVRDADGKITVFDAPNAGTGSNQGTVAYSINSEGTIAGQFQTCDNVYYGFVRSSRGQFVVFDIPGFKPGAQQGPGGSANINDVEEVAGFYTDENYVNHGFLRSSDGRIATFDAPGVSTIADFPPQGTTVALESGLNQNGALTGWYYDSNQAVHGYVRAENGVITDFDNRLAGTAAYQGTYPGSINTQGEITGGVADENSIFHGFVRSPDGKTQTFEVLGSGDTTGSGQGTFGVGINDAGEVTAYWTDSSNLTHGAVRYCDGRVTTFDVEGAGSGAGQGTTPQGINAAGAVPGYYTDSNNVNHGFLRLP